MSQKKPKSAANHRKDAALARVIPAALRPEEVATLFTPEEIARLKLEALGGADAEKRLAALRRLRYAPLDAREKGGVFLQVLLDPAGPLRSEAIKGLESLGFDRETAAALRDVFGANEARRLTALDRIRARFLELREAEQRIALMALLEALRELNDPAQLSRILGALAEGAIQFAAHPELAAELIPSCARCLEAGMRIERPVAQTLGALAQAAPALVAREVTRLLETPRPAPVRVFFLTLLAQAPAVKTPPELARPALAERIVAELISGEDAELDQQKLGHNLVSLGVAAAKPLLRAARAGDQRVRRLLIPYLDLLADTVAEAAPVIPAILEFMLSCLRDGDRRLRLEAIQSSLLARRDMPLAAKRRLAQLLVQEMSQHSHPEAPRRIDHLLEHLGAAAAGPLLDLLRQTPRGPEADRAIRILARVAAHEHPDKPTANLREKLLRLAEKYAADPDAPSGYAWALGILTASESVNAQRADAAVSILLQPHPRRPLNPDAIDALGHILGNPGLSLARRVAVVRLLLALLEWPALRRRPVMRRVQSEEGILYEAAQGADFDADILPSVIGALQRVCLDPAASSNALREQILDNLLSVWRQVAEWKVVWGPKGNETIVAALGALGQSPRLDSAQRAAIARALAPRIERHNVVRALGQIAGANDQDREFRELLLDAARAVIRRWRRAETADEEYRLALESLAMIAARAGADRKAALLRRRVANLLLAELREERFWPRSPLERIRDAADCPRDLKQDIAKRLNEFFSLTPRP